MFSRIAQSIFFVIAVAMAALAQAQPAPSRQEEAGRTSIIIDRQLVRFVAQGESLEWRLEVVNQQGEMTFDSGLVNGVSFEWPLMATTTAAGSGSLVKATAASPGGF